MAPTPPDEGNAPKQQTAEQLELNSKRAYEQLQNMGYFEGTDRAAAAKGYTHGQRGHSRPDGTIQWEKPKRLPGARPRCDRVIRSRATVRASHRTRPGHRRAGATSPSASSDPGDDGPTHEHPQRGELRHVRYALAALLVEIGGLR